MNKIKLLAIISLALAAMVSPIGCLGRKKLQQKSSEATIPPSVTESRIADSSTTGTPSGDVEAIVQSQTGESEVPEETVEPSNIEAASMETEEEPMESVSDETGSYEPEESAEPSATPASPTAAPTSTAVPETESALERPTEKPTTKPTVPSSTAPSESSVAVCVEHDFEYSEPVPPTCASEGIMRLTCRVCGYVFEGPLNKLDHTWNGGEITTAPTCASNGVRTYTCSGCGAKRTEAIPAQGEHHYVATKTVPQTKIGGLADLGYTVYTCDRCGVTINADYEGYLDCAWRYQRVNAFRTGPGRFFYNEDGTITYFNKEGYTQLQPFSTASGLESIAQLRAKQEAYDIYNEGRLDHSHDGLPYAVYYGNNFWGGLNCECCQAGGTEFYDDLDGTFRNEEAGNYSRQGHLRIELNAALKYIGIGAYVYHGRIVVVCEYSDIPK